MLRLYFKLSLALLSCLGASHLLATESAPKLAASDCEFSEVYVFTPAVCAIHLRNSGSSPIRVSNFHTLFPGDSATPSSLTIEPQGEAEVELHLDTSDMAGNFIRYIDFSTNEPGHRKRKIEARGYVMSALDESHPKLDLGKIDATQKMLTKELALTSHEVADFRLVKVLESPEWLDAKIKGDHRTLAVTMKPDAPWGVHEDVVKLAINTPRQKEVWVHVEANVYGDGADTPLDVKGSAASPEDKSGPPGKIATTSASESGGASPSHSTKFPGVASEGVPLKTERDVSPKSGDSVGKMIADGTKFTDPAPTQPTPPGTGPLLKWTVAHEDPVYGYQIFRAQSEQGPFVLQNVPAIPADHDHPGTRYQWRDQTVEHGKTYWYYIGIANKDGTKKVLSKPHKTVAK